MDDPTRNTGAMKIRYAALILLLMCSPLRADILGEARRHVEAQRYSEALALYETLLQQRPNDADLLIEAARVNGWNDQHARAIELYRRVLELAPQRVGDVRLALAWQLLWAGQAQEAQRMFAAETAAYPDKPEALHGLAEAAVANNHLDIALDSYRRLLRLDPNDMKAILGEARVLQWLGRDREAVQAYERILAQRPDNREAKLRLARSYNALGRHQRAAKLLGAEVTPASANDDRVEYARALRWAGLDNRALSTIEGLETAAAGDLRRQLQFDLADRVSLMAGYSNDSDELESYTTSIATRIHIGETRELGLSARRAVLDQHANRIYGTRYILNYGGRVGSHDSGYGILWPRLEVGERRFAGWHTAAWKISAKWLPADLWRVDLEAGNDIIENIRSIQNRVRLDYASAGFDYRFAPRWLASLGLMSARFDDTNRRTRASGRIEYLTLTDPRLILGIEAMGFNDSAPPSPNRGYYSPDRYREVKFAATVQKHAVGWDLYFKGALGHLTESPGSGSTLYTLEAAASRPLGNQGTLRLNASRSDSASVFTKTQGGYVRNHFGAALEFRF